MLYVLFTYCCLLIVFFFFLHFSFPHNQVLISSVNNSANSSASSNGSSSNDSSPSSPSPPPPFIASPVICWSCGRGYSSSDMVKSTAVLTSLGQEKEEVVCQRCRAAQAVILWFKAINLTNLLTLHEIDDTVVNDFDKYKVTFLLFSRNNPNVEASYDQMKSRKISIDEFKCVYKEALDRSWRMQLTEARRIKDDLEGIEDDLQTIISIAAARPRFRFYPMDYETCCQNLRRALEEKIVYSIS